MYYVLVLFGRTKRSLVLYRLRLTVLITVLRYQKINCTITLLTKWISITKEHVQVVARRVRPLLMHHVDLLSAFAQTHKVLQTDPHPISKY